VSQNLNVTKYLKPEENIKDLEIKIKLIPE
jgi:hypothetical protein